MHWQSFLKGSFFSVFLLLLFLTGFSLVSQVRREQTIANSAVYPVEQKNYLAGNGHFAAVLGSASVAEPLQNFSVLLLGLDARKGDRFSRCDAIHTVSFLPNEGKIKIFSVPRGTMSKDGNIIANVCSIYGYDTAKDEIEKITGVAADYVVKAGFSQTMGAFRLLGLPPSPTLQFLRDRKNYVIGDNQRSYNQGTFLKDMLAGRLDQVNALPEAVKFLGFKALDTDIGYKEAQKILGEIIASGIYKDPKNIEVIIKPKDNLVRQEIHLDDKTAADWTFSNDPEYQAYQQEITAYLENVLAGQNLDTIRTAVSQRLWLQLDDTALRSYFETALTSFLP